MKLAYEALAAGGWAPAVLNAANEVAVARFLEGTIGFTEIPQLIQAVLARCETGHVDSLEDVLEADRAARACAEHCLAQLASRSPGARSGAASTARLNHTGLAS
jgi:1-deoxy-D-xylulose-5-phosphate reductoisomerase